jgi:hypothetical protein
MTPFQIEVRIICVHTLRPAILFFSPLSSHHWMQLILFLLSCLPVGRSIRICTWLIPGMAAYGLLRVALPPPRACGSEL